MENIFYKHEEYYSDPLYVASSLAQHQQQQPSPVSSNNQSPNDRKSQKLFINTQLQTSVHKSDASGGLNSGYATSAVPSPTSAARKKANSGGLRFIGNDQIMPLVSGNRKLVATLQPRVEGGFFYVDGVSTCYRRNYFRILSTLSLVDMNDPTFCLTENNTEYLHMIVNGEKIRVKRFQVNLSAFSNLSHQRKIDLIMQVSKRDKGPHMSPQAKFICPGGNPDDPAPAKTPLTPVGQQMSFVSTDQRPTVIAFDRVQFRSATANNGKRKSIQQYFKVRVELFAVTDNDECYKVVDCVSEEIVVRGRSPSHYADVERMKERRRENTLFGEGPNPMMMVTPEVNRRASWSSLLMPANIQLSAGPQSAYPTLFQTQPFQQMITPAVTPRLSLTPTKTPIASGPVYSTMFQGQLSPFKEGSSLMMIDEENSDPLTVVTSNTPPLSSDEIPSAGTLGYTGEQDDFLAFNATVTDFSNLSW